MELVNVINLVFSVACSLVFTAVFVVLLSAQTQKYPGAPALPSQVGNGGKVLGTNGSSLGFVPAPRNAASYGTKADGVTDDTTSIQNAINTVCATTNGGQIFFPYGNYLITKPLTATCNNLFLQGDSTSGTIFSSSFYGPVLFHHPPLYQGITTGTALLTGTGSAMRLLPGDGSNATYLNLGEAYSVRQLNGLAAFTIEGTLKLNSSVTSGFHTISSSYGRAQVSTTPTFAYRLFITGTNKISFWWTIGGVANAMTTADNALTVGTSSHVAVTYNGSAVKIWVDGVQAATSAVSGTWNQSNFENVFFGAEVTDWPEGNFNNGLLAPDCWVDSFRISNIARYSTSFTKPSAKFTNDGNTLILLNFDSQYDSNKIIKGYTNVYPAWLAARTIGDTATGGYVERLDIHHIQFNLNGAYGPLLARSILGNMSNNQWLSGAGGSGPVYSTYSYQNTFADNYLNGGTDTTTQFGLIIADGSGAGTKVDRTVIWGYHVQLALYNAGIQANSVYLQETSGVKYSLISKAVVSSVPATVFTNLVTSGEGADGGLLVPIYLSSYGTQFVGGRLEAPTAIAPVTIDGGSSVAFRGTHFFSIGSSASEMVTIQSAPSSPFLIDKTVKTQAGIPYSLTTSSVAIAVTYTGTAPAINDCAKFVDISGNVTSAGAACGSGSGSGASAAYQLTDFLPARVTTTITNDSLTWNTTNTTTTPSVIAQNGTATQFTGFGKCKLSGTSNSGTIYFYFDGGATKCGNNTSTTVTATGTNNAAVGSISAFPYGSVPLFTWTYTANVFDASGFTDFRAVYRNQQLIAGSGITIDTSTNTISASGGGGSTTVTDHLRLPVGTCNGGSYQAGSWSWAGVSSFACFAPTAADGGSGVQHPYVASADNTFIASTVFLDPANLVSVDVRLAGFAGSSTANTLTFTSKIGCITGGVSFAGGTQNSGIAASASSTTANNILFLDMATIPITSCAAGDEMFLTLYRSGSYANNFYLTAVDIKLNRTLP